MNPLLRDVHLNIRNLGLAALAHANWHAHYRHPNNDATGELSVLQAAHAAELLIKARIAQEHPLLIFDQLPKSSTTATGVLSFQDLFENGRTFDYSDLPARLWAVTGQQLPGLARFREFGKLRNAIQHFAPPDALGDEVSRFIFEVIGPLIHDSWGLFAIDYNEDDDPYTYLMAFLVRREIPFAVSPDAAKDWTSCRDYLRISTAAKPTPYLREMSKRVAAAMAPPPASRQRKPKTTR
jgi:hypothetical protein